MFERRRYDTQVATKAIGLVEATVYTTQWQDQYEVVFSQAGMNKLSRITTFCGGRYFQRNGNRYMIIRRKPTEYANELWLELEQIGSNLIQLNT